MRVKLEECWLGVLIYANNIVLMAGLGVELQTMLEVVQAYEMSWRSSTVGRVRLW